MAKERIKKVIKKMSEIVKQKDGKKPSQTKVAIDCGYSESYAKSGHFKKTEVWSELMDIYLPNSKLAKVHSDLLGSAEIQHYIFPKDRRKEKMSKVEIKMIVESVPGCRLIYIKDDHYAGQVAFYQAPDSHNRKDALDMVYKLKGNYSPEKVELTKRKYQDLSNKELAELEQTLIKFLRKK